MLFAFAFFSVWFLEGCLCMTHSNMTIFYWFHNTLDSLLMGTTPSNAFTLDYFNNLCAKGNCAGALFSLGRVYFASVLDNGTGTTCWSACGRCPVWNTFLNVSFSFFLCKRGNSSSQIIQGISCTPVFFSNCFTLLSLSAPIPSRNTFLPALPMLVRA